MLPKPASLPLPLSRATVPWRSRPLLNPCGLVQWRSLTPAENLPCPRSHAQKLPRAFVKDRLGNLQRFVLGVLALLDPLGERPRKLASHKPRLGISPLNAVSVREEPCLFVRGQ